MLYDETFQPQRLDAVTLAAASRECSAVLAGARVQKIHQVGIVEYVLECWLPFEKKRPDTQAISPPTLDASSPAEVKEKPFTATHVYLNLNRQTPFFALLHESDWKPLFPNLKQHQSVSPLLASLRKHLQGARLLQVSCTPAEPVLRLRFHTTDELGFTSTVELIAELMGKYANLMLCDAESRRILQMMHVVDESQSRLRPLHVGGLYQDPPRPADRVPFEAVDVASVLTVAEGPYTPEAALKRLQAVGWGVSPLFFRPVLAACQQWEEARIQVQALQQTYQPVLKYGAGATHPVGYHGVALPGYVRHEGHVLSVLREYYWPWRCACIVEQARHRLRQPLRQKHRSLRERIMHVQEHRVSEDTLARLQEEGDVLMTLYGMKAFDTFKPLQPSYTPDINPLTGEPGVPLQVDERYTWLENAQRRYRQVRKAQGRNAYASEHTALLTQELLHIQTLEVMLEQATRLEDLPALEADLIQFKLLASPKRPAPTRRKPVKSRPEQHTGIETFELAEGLVLLVGRSSRGNGHLVSRHLRPMDWWCHAGEQIPGSHVILKTQGTPWEQGPLPDDILLRMAQAAAWFSAGQESSKVPVLFTRGKYVRAIPGSWPGHVNHTHEESVMVPPQHPSP
jgi:predicted ribosome quality control (RQC) complex YloA/Tae2 family protein